MTTAERYRELADTLEVIGLSDSAEAFDVDRDAAEREIIAALREAAAVTDRLCGCTEEAERNAWDSLSRYKFLQFGYWAAIWVHLNRIRGSMLPSPFGALVTVARGRGFGPTRSRQHEVAG